MQGTCGQNRKERVMASTEQIAFISLIRANYESPIKDAAFITPSLPIAVLGACFIIVLCLNNYPLV